MYLFRFVNGKQTSTKYGFIPNLAIVVFDCRPFIFYAHSSINPYSMPDLSNNVRARRTTCQFLWNILIVTFNYCEKDKSRVHVHRVFTILLAHAAQMKWWVCTRLEIKTDHILMHSIGQHWSVFLCVEKLELR
jgi:hypothetical protein